MADRIEREIEEILERLEKKGNAPARPQPPSGTGKDPIVFPPRRRRRSIASRIASGFTGNVTGLTPANLLFVGAGVMIVGFVLATFWEPLIWLSLAGVGTFLFAFVWSFFRRPGRPAGAPERYWRGQRIDYDTPHAGPITRFKRIFRRR
ncbi:MAG: hypothetical protein Kow0010_09520 [Dehalococcoidia bacterium]